MDPQGNLGIWEQLEATYLVPKWWPVVASVYYYSFTICLASFLRNISKGIFPKKTVIYILDMITTFQVCACSLENASVRHYHGFPGYLFAVFSLAILHSITFKGFRGNPLANVTGYLRNEQTLQKTLLRMAFQMTGGLMSYRYAKMLWRFRLNDIHLTRADMLCRNDLSIDPTLGFLVEFAGTVFETYISFCTLSSKPAIDMAVKQTIAIINLALGKFLSRNYFVTYTVYMICLIASCPHLNLKPIHLCASIRQQ